MAAPWDESDGTRVDHGQSDRMSFLVHDSNALGCPDLEVKPHREEQGKGIDDARGKRTLGRSQGRSNEA
jgi:hypothetical protein